MTVKEFIEKLSLYEDFREISIADIVGDICEPEVELNPFNGRIQIYGGKNYDS